ncbi:hypothetical protein Lal_00019243 [Lupinus albus]|nr:hypothetical protein Lal_00019243 [Lupinus albus]
MRLTLCHESRMFGMRHICRGPHPRHSKSLSFTSFSEEEQPTPMYVLINLAAPLSSTSSSSISKIKVISASGGLVFVEKKKEHLMLNKLHNLVYKMELTMQILGASSFSIYNLQLPLDVIVRKEDLKPSMLFLYSTTASTNVLS